MLCCMQPPEARNFSVSVVLKLKLLVESYLRRGVSNSGLFPEPPASLWVPSCPSYFVDLKTMKPYYDELSAQIENTCLKGIQTEALFQKKEACTIGKKTRKMLAFTNVQVCVKEN